MDLKTAFLKQREAIHNRTREVTALIAPSQMAFRPARDVLSVGETLRHMWMSESGMRRVALLGDFSYLETRIPQGLHAVLGTVGSFQEELAAADREYDATLTEVAAYPVEQLEVERIHPGLGYRRKVFAILLGINEHQVHHRAQLMTYLRILGIRMPGI